MLGPPQVKHRDIALVPPLFPALLDHRPLEQSLSAICLDAHVSQVDERAALGLARARVEQRCERCGLVAKDRDLKDELAWEADGRRVAVGVELRVRRVVRHVERDGLIRRHAVQRVGRVKLGDLHEQGLTGQWLRAGVM